MIWQDLVFLIGNVVGGAILLPTLFDSDAYVPKTSSIPTTILFIAYIYTFYSLEMYYSAGGSMFIFTVWLGIAIFRNTPQNTSTDTPQNTSPTPAD